MGCRPDTFCYDYFVVDRKAQPAETKFGERTGPLKATSSRADEVRARLAQLGIDEADVEASVSWARNKRD